MFMLICNLFFSNIIVVESGDTNEDTEARALLNKFLGASVILHGMEQGNKSPASVTTTSSAALVNQVEKQRAQVQQ